MYRVTAIIHRTYNVPGRRGADAARRRVMPGTTFRRGPAIPGLRLSGVLMLLCLAACGDGGKDQVAAAPAAGPSLARDVQPIFDANCVQCHMTGVAQGNLLLEDGAVHAALVNRRSSEAAMDLVTPGQPNASYLYLKMTGGHIAAGGQGAGMPLIEGVYKPLDAASLATVRSWIEAGAPQN